MTPRDYRTSTKVGVVLLRISLGWMMFYAGITKVLDPAWSAAGFLENAAFFQSFFAWFAQPEILPLTNTLNAWGLMLIGVALLLGLFVRISSLFAIFLMVLYYLPVLPASTGGYTLFVDNHVIYAAGFLLLAGISAGRFAGFDVLLRKHPFVAYNPLLRSLIG